jgi:hypothetical protein
MVDSSDVSTTPLDRWVDEPTKKWRVLERTTNVQRIQVTPVASTDTELEKKTLTPGQGDHYKRVPLCGVLVGVLATPVAVDPEVEKTTSEPEFKIEEEPSVDQERTNSLQWVQVTGDAVEPVEPEVEKTASEPEFKIEKQPSVDLDRTNSLLRVQVTGYDAESVELEVEKTASLTDLKIEEEPSVDHVKVSIFSKVKKKITIILFFQG